MCCPPAPLPAPAYLSHTAAARGYLCRGHALADPSGPVLPPALLQFQCHCEKIWYSVVRCRVVDAQGMPLPIPW